MPRRTDPDSRIRVVLKCDEDKSPQPAFFFKPLVMRDFHRFEEVLERIRAKESTLNSMYAEVIPALTPLLVGWEHMGVDFDVEQLEDLINIQEGVELISRLSVAGQLTHEEKKSCELPPSFETDSSATPVEPDVSEANTNQST